MATPARRVFRESHPLYYPFGNTHSKNVFENIRSEIGADQRNYVTKMLFLGCGDLRNTLQATSSTKHNHLKTLHIHLNDSNYSIMARNILMLKIIATAFNPNNQENIDFLWDVWYNAEWPESTRKRFQQALKGLLDGCLPENVVIAKSSQLQCLRKVWTFWSSIVTADDHESQWLVEKIKSERANIMMTSVKTPLDITDSSSFSRAIDEIMMPHAGNHVGLEDLPNETAQKIRDEFRFYFEHGSCRLKSKVTTVCINPTLLNPISLGWHVIYNLCPFEGYVPLRKEELDMSSKDGILIRSCQKILKNLVSAYRRRIDDVKLFFHLEDALELCYTGTKEMFDIIDCSNLADHVGLANLLNATSRRLLDAPGSVLFTESMNWRTLAPSVAQYLEKVLCVPLNMIPTVYGLQQLNHVELGSLVPVEVQRLMVSPVNLCWGKAPSFQNISLHSSPTLTRCLQQLITRCFFAKDPKKMKLKDPEPIGSMACYTPLTFYYVVSSLIQRVGGDQWFNDALDKLNFDPVFHLSQRTTNAWKKGEKIIKFSKTVPIEQPCENTLLRLKHIPFLRLVLIPFSTMGPAFLLETLQNGLPSQGVHYIDNLQVKVRHSADGEMKTTDISFLLVADYDLKEICSGYVIDILSGLPVFFFPTMTSLRVEEFCLPYPFGSMGSQFPLASSQMVVESCVESDSQYTLKISIGCLENISGLKITTDQQKPCESAHKIILSLSQPQGIKPLTLSFPHPFLVDDIKATLYREDGFVQLVMTKAVKEPWPMEFGANKKSKLVVQLLKPWEEKKETLDIHLGSQFTLSMLKNPLESTKSALDKVREIIKSIFVGSCVNGQEYFGVQRQETRDERSDWLVRVHPPVRTTPAGSPILLVSTVDCRLTEKLTNQGKLDKRKAEEDFVRIMAGKEDLLTCLMNSEEEAQLWRYVLRLNSTKMMPSSWQKINLPLGENSPWLATFISPLYVDCVFEYPFFKSNEQGSAGKMTRVKESCASCKKTLPNSKCCSRCRAVVYCSVECQRAHWSEHKIGCFKK